MPCPYCYTALQILEINSWKVEKEEIGCYRH
jgi:hypothetical protein